MAIKCPKCQAENQDSKQYCGDCGTRLPTSRGISAEMTETVRTPIKELTRGGTFAGRYDIIEELGRGGMGKVYRVFDRKIEEEVALKLIRPDIAADREIIDRFRNELRMSRKISHRNVSRMFDLGEDDGVFFITMEYVPGEDLKSFIHRSKQLSVGTLVSIAKQICEGLEEAHGLGIVHRDLKPGNIMIDKEGNVRIMDFGIARSLSVRSNTGAGVMIGTPEYMSPEQVEGKDVDPRSDIYSLGIILYEMATGKVPFGGDTPFTIGMKHKSEKPANPKEFNRQIPDDLSRLILKCLEKAREKRYQTAGELRSDLEKIEKAIPTTERDIAGRRPLSSRLTTVKHRLGRLALPSLAVIALVVIALVASKFLPRRRVAPPVSGKPTLAILYFENISGDKMLDAWKTGLTELLIAKLGQSRLIRVLDGNTIYGLMKRLNLDDVKKYTKEDLLKIATEGGAKYTLSGSLLKAGPDIVMTFSLQKPQTGEVISPISVDCKSEEEIIPKIDEVAAKIKADLNLSIDQIAADPDKKAGTITTTSAEAFKDYSEGRKYHVLGDYQRCIEWMQKAVSLDPEFAMAYRSMGSAYGNLGQAVECRKYYQKALEFKDRVSDRERLSIEGDFYRQSETTLGKAVEAYQKLLDLYPDDVIGNTNLGVLYGNIEEWDKSIARYKYLLAIGTDNVITVGNLAEAYQATGQYAEAEEVLKNYLSRDPENSIILGKLAQNYAFEGKYDLALPAIFRAESLNPADFSLSWTKTGIYFLTDDLSATEQEIIRLRAFANPSAKLGASAALVQLYVYQGRFMKAVEEINSGLEMAKKGGDQKSMIMCLMMHSTIDQLVYRNFDAALRELDEAMSLAVASQDLGMQRAIVRERGVIDLGKNSVAEAERAASELKALCEKAASKRQMSLYFDLLARIELKKKEYGAALDHIRQMISLWSAPLPSELLASAYDTSGDKKKALEEYQRIIASPWMKLNDSPTYLISFYRLGRVSEDLGLKDKAVGYFQRFLDLWKNADPGVPLVDAARKRLAALKGK